MSPFLPQLRYDHQHYHNAVTAYCGGSLVTSVLSSRPVPTITLPLLNVADAAAGFLVLPSSTRQTPPTSRLYLCRHCLDDTPPATTIIGTISDVLKENRSSAGAPPPSL
ncbi:hypothetical protein Hanom_Chr05g00432241 [Helianthus anomalus]